MAARGLWFSRDNARPEPYEQVFASIDLLDGLAEQTLISVGTGFRVVHLRPLDHRDLVGAQLPAWRTTTATDVWRTIPESPPLSASNREPAGNEPEEGGDDVKPSC